MGDSVGFKINPDELVTFEDGFKYWWPLGYVHGAFQSHHLRAIADQLDEINKPWSDQINSDPRVSIGTI